MVSDGKRRRREVEKEGSPEKASQENGKGKRVLEGKERNRKREKEEKKLKK